MLIDYPEPPLARATVALRSWLPADLTLIAEASGEPELVALTTLPDPFTDAAGLAFLERQWRRARDGEGLSLAIVEGGSGVAVGGASLMLRRPPVADLGYWLVAGARGRGIGSAAAGLLVAWACQQAAIDAIEAFVAPENCPSRRVLEKCGLRVADSRRHAVGRIDRELLVYRRER